MYNILTQSKQKRIHQTIRQNWKCVKSHKIDNQKSELNDALHGQLDQSV